MEIVKYLIRKNEMTAKQLSENQLWGSGELCNFPQSGPGQSPGRKCIFMYVELENCTWWAGGKFFFTNALRKNSCNDKKCRKDLQKLTPTKNFRGNLEFPWEFPTAVCLEEMLPRKTIIGTEVAHITRDSDTNFEVKRSRSL